jgi:hypothetical protein
MGFNIRILSGKRPSQNLDVRAAVAASFNPDSVRKPHALGEGGRRFGPRATLGREFGFVCSAAPKSIHRVS